MTYEFLHPCAVDLNGAFRGKRVLANDLGKLEQGRLRMPLSVLNVDITGADIDGSPLVFETGDRDGALRMTERGPVPLPWLDSQTALVPMMMYDESGAPFMGDARQALCATLAGFEDRGWRVVAATEMEFHLVDDTGSDLRHPLCPRSGRRLDAAEILSASQLEVFDGFLSDLAQGAAAMGLEIASMTIEAGVGQFEVTLQHCDALKAADDAVLFKSLARGMARKHGFAATFMAKPFAEDAGNGMHVHFSVLDGDGRNIFDDGCDAGTPLLRAAVAGCLELMCDATLVFAPHGNSFARLVRGAHAPTGAGWGFENRTVALRIPAGPSAARRIEHRVAGGDTNPYLIFATILAGALHGIKTGARPPAPITGNAYDKALPQMAESWDDAIGRFEKSKLLRACLPGLLIDNLVRTKQQEQKIFAALEGPDWPLLLENV